MGFSKNSGIGTIHNRKQRGKRARRKALGPKETTKAPIHHTTNASMFTESCSSRRKRKICNLATTVAATAATSKIKPTLDRDSCKDSDDFHSRHINVTLTGRISNMCVYRSSRKARASVEMRGLHQISKEIAPRMEKRKSGDNLEVDSWVELVSTMECLRYRIRTHGKACPPRCDCRSRSAFCARTGEKLIKTSIPQAVFLHLLLRRNRD